MRQGGGRIADRGQPPRQCNHGTQPVQVALGAARMLEEFDISAEVIDPRTVWPLDEGTVLDSVARTSRLLVVQEAAAAGGVAGLVLGLVARAGFEQLDAPPVLVAAPDTPVPFAPELEDAYVPSAELVRAALEELLAY